MIKDILNANENITAGTTAVNKLKAVLPQCFDKDGNLYFDKLKEFLRDEVSFADENYGLNFLGKSYARLLQAMETDTVITPDEDHNKQPQNADSENIYITGDNLDALKHLLKSYENKIKCIYIDPPYNTGSDGFVYNDRFTFTKETLAQKLSISEETAERILELTNSGSASHSAWLTFMYPRLLLARDLLTEDGVIFISIDDNEQANLKLLCDDVFGEQNFIGEITVVANPRGRDYGGIARMHDYILAYRSSEKTVINLIKDENGEFTMFDELGGFELRELRNRNIKFNRENRPNLYYPFFINDANPDENGLYEISLEVHDGWRELYPLESQGVQTVWRWGKERSNKNLNVNIMAKPMRKGSFMIVEKYREARKMARSVWWDKDSNTEKGTLLVKQIFCDEKVFDYPKPKELIEKLCEMGMNFDEEEIILDFFSGSATTAHAVMQLNAEDGGNRKFILVQLPEATKEGSEARLAGYETIDQIGRERIKRAAAKIKEEYPDITADLGFKHFKLNQLNNTQLSQIETFSPELNLVGSDDLLKNFGTPTVLTTWLNRDGYGLNPSVKVENLANYTAYICGTHIYLLESNFDNQALMELCRRYEEDEDFAKITNIIVFGYSFSYTDLQALQDNIKKFSVTRNSRINVEIRY